MKLNKIFRTPLMRKASTRWLLVLDIAMWLALALYAIIRVRPRDSAVAARYSTLQDLVDLGPWQWHYLPLLFLLITLGLNIFIANTLLKAEEAVELHRFAVKVLFFQFLLSLLTFTVSFQMIEAL